MGKEEKIKKIEKRGLTKRKGGDILSKRSSRGNGAERQREAEESGTVLEN